MIASLLIANRGEIACRIIRTARAMGVRTVAVYSDADAKALHVRMADEAVHIGASPARESYLVGDKIIAAAKATGAEAIHPGYGFLSENADFAQAVIDAGLVWVGPKPDSIRAMGLKDAAKNLMSAAGVPVTPGYIGDDQSPERLQQEADAIGYPVLIKAVAGGGGKGMRKVERAEDFQDALESCQREAASSFGNAIVLLEKYILSPRHIEVQVFGDSHGNVVHLFERDCSLQRRHQKVIEEAPAPGMDEATRAEICCAAICAAKAVDYEGAGTIEFIADTSDRKDGGSGLRADRIWFMEMNTRLQVEHPVTEEITGVDLVEWQLRVASGEKLPKRQDELTINGHAIEARLYAEDPEKGFLPSVGRIDGFAWFGDEENWPTDPKIRYEGGVEGGMELSPFYDPMIAKIVAHAPTRERARSALVDHLRDLAIYPLRWNGGFLVQCLSNPAFVQADLDTGFIERNIEALVLPRAASDEAIEAAAVAILADSIDTAIGQNFGLRPFIAGLSDFRVNASAKNETTVFCDGQARKVSFLRPGAPRKYRVDWERNSDRAMVVQNGETFVVESRFDGGTTSIIGDGAIIAPMPGKVTSVEVASGDTVTKGQRLLTLEAMKMEHGLVAPFDGVVAELNTSRGAQVQVDALLAKIQKKEE